MYLRASYWYSHMILTPRRSYSWRGEYRLSKSELSLCSLVRDIELGTECSHSLVSWNKSKQRARRTLAPGTLRYSTQCPITHKRLALSLGNERMVKCIWMSDCRNAWEGLSEIRKDHRITNIFFENFFHFLSPFFRLYTSKHKSKVCRISKPPLMPKPA